MMNDLLWMCGQRSAQKQEQSHVAAIWQGTDRVLQNRDDAHEGRFCDTKISGDFTDKEEQGRSPACVFLVFLIQFSKERPALFLWFVKIYPENVWIIVSCSGMLYPDKGRQSKMGDTHGLVAEHPMEGNGRL